MLIHSQTAIQSGYRSQAADTSVEADVFAFAMLRQKTVADRVQMGLRLTSWAKAVSLRGMRKAKGAAFGAWFAQSILADKWLPILTPTSDPTMWIQDPGETARSLHPIFERLQIPYYITGGVAAIAYGDPRTTRDLDLVIELDRAKLVPLITALEQAGFYCPPGAVEDIQQGRAGTLSVTHRETILNADLIVHANSAFDRAKMLRRRLEALDLAGVEQFWLISPEDLVLSKLLWGRQIQSEKQWRDVLGVLKVQGETLDFAYLVQWGNDLGIAERLAQAFEEAGV